MKLFAFPMAMSITTALFVLTACGESDFTTSTPKDDLNTDVQMDSVKTSDDLPNCTEKRQETVAYIKDDSSIRICLDEKWEAAESVVATKEDLLSCSPKREASTAYVMDEHAYYTCTDERWQKGLKEYKGGSSDSKGEETSSSSENIDNLSSSGENESSGEDNKSSTVEESSSSTKSEESSSSKEIKPAKASLTTTIYDTDATLHPLFSCDAYPTVGGNSCKSKVQDEVFALVVDDAVSDCIGVIQGIVERTLDENKKPVLTEDGKKCFIEKKYFDQLFNYTEGVNEVVAWEMPYVQNEDGLWGFNSDTLRYGNDVGGFFPVESTTDDDILIVDGKKLGPTEGARTLRKNEAPFVISDTVDFYHYCNSYGWTEGNRCANLFADGSKPSLWTWDGIVERWTGMRNSHFCMEIHGTFTYSEDLEAAFSANGDQWVFIGNKLAVDNGGTHVNAPSFVQLKQLNKAYGWFMKVGKEYPIDIFYCARRTTISGFSIQTNFAITQD